MEKIPINLQNNNESVIKQNENNQILEKQELYSRIMQEVESVAILESDEDKEGNLLAPNGERSNLEEQDWKITRTPSFIRFFGNWKEKYNTEEYNLWVKFQEKQSYEDEITKLQKHKNEKRNSSMQAIDGLEESGLMDKNEMKNKHLEEIKENNKSYQNRIIDLTQKVSKIQAELINSDFNIHSHNLEYGKVLDENGEPFLLCRGTQRDLDDNGNFIIPEKEHYGEKFKVGVFLGKENEA